MGSQRVRHDWATFTIHRDTSASSNHRGRYYCWNLAILSAQTIGPFSSQSLCSFGMCGTFFPLVLYFGISQNGSLTSKLNFLCFFLSSKVRKEWGKKKEGWVRSSGYYISLATKASYERISPWDPFFNPLVPLLEIQAKHLLQIYQGL